MRFRIWFKGTLLVLLALCVGGCGSDRPEDTGAANEPAAAVLLLAAHLRANDLNAFVHAAVPPDLQSPLQQAWRENRSRWPLDELPFGERVPGIVSALAAPKAEQRLRRDFDQQFANANRDIRAAASTLGLFGAKFVQSDAALSEEERAHLTQQIRALSEWAKTAKLGDTQRARRSIAQLTTAARRSGLKQPDDFGRFGMAESLRRLGPVFGSLKGALNQYGLDIDRSLEDMTATLESQDGDSARVRMRYPLGGQTIDTVVALQRVGGRWYLRDYLRHARAAAAPPPEVPQPLPAPPDTHGEARGADAGAEFVIMSATMPTQPTLPLFEGAPPPDPSAPKTADADEAAAVPTQATEPSAVAPTLSAPGEALPAVSASAIDDAASTPVDAQGEEHTPEAAPADEHDPEQAELPMSAAPAVETTPEATAPVPRGRRPWWSRLLGKVIEPWIELRIESLPEGLVADPRPVCYVLERYGLSNALILDRACRDAGLPSPLRPLPVAGDPLGRKRAYVALSRRHGSALNLAADLAAGKAPAPAKSHSESLARLLRCASQRRDDGRASGPGLDLRRPRAGTTERLVLGAVLGKLDDRRPLRGAYSRFCSTAATPWCNSPRRSRCATW